MITAKITLKSDKKIKKKKKLMEEKETNLESNMMGNSNDGQTYRPSTTFPQKRYSEYKVDQQISLFVAKENDHNNEEITRHVTKYY